MQEEELEALLELEAEFGEAMDRRTTRSRVGQLAPAAVFALQGLAAGPPLPGNTAMPPPPHSVPAPSRGQLSAANTALGGKQRRGTDNPFPLSSTPPGGPPVLPTTFTGFGLSEPRFVQQGGWMTVAPAAGLMEGEAGIASGVPSRLLLEHLGYEARAASSEAEAEAFIGAMVPAAAAAFPQAFSTLLRVAPPLIQGAASLGQALRQSSGRRLVLTLPTIVQRTTASLARRAASGMAVPPQMATQALRQEAQRLLRDPQQVAATLQSSRRLEQRYRRLRSWTA